MACVATALPAKRQGASGDAGVCVGMGALKHLVGRFVVFVLWVASCLLLVLLSLFWLLMFASACRAPGSLWCGRGIVAWSTSPP